MVEFDATAMGAEFQDNAAPSIWCLACQDNLVIAGCANGRLEVSFANIILQLLLFSPNWNI